MSGHQNVIELNGNLYDAITGKVVTASMPVEAPQPVIVKPQSSGTVLDGFIRNPKAHTPSHAKPPVSHKVHKQVDRPAPKHAATRAPHKAKTLMRRGLKKPVLHDESAPQNHPEPTQGHNRLDRAKAVPKSPHISRFGSAVAHSHHIIKKAAPLRVKPAPKHAPHHSATAHTTAAPNTNQVLKEQLVAKAIKDARVPEAHKHKPRSHRAAKKLGVHPKLLHAGTGILAALVLVGFIAYQNVPNISMRIAASRAGFNATIPGYRPSGFAMKGPIEYGPGQVTINFKSNSDGRNFHVTQRVSSWNSEALLSNFVIANNKSYQTYQDKGRTIYIYDGSNATWVSDGVWYQIEGNSSLNSDQLINLASSI